jgi:pyridoxine kinase
MSSISDEVSTGMKAAYHDRTPRVLSLQSYSVHGYVGNKSATFPLQCMGLDVSAINTVTLSNRPGYPGGYSGKEMDPNELLDLIKGLDANSLLNFDIVISGYVSSLAMLHGLGEGLNTVRQAAPNAFFVCDPVLGDNGKYYVPSELLDAYKNVIIPMSNAVMPNAFETGVLTGVDVKNIDSAREACRRLHEMGPEYCLLKGVNLHGESDQLSMVLSSKSNKKLFCIDTPKLDFTFFGCGDLCTAVASAWLLKHSDNLPLVLEKVSGTMHAVTARTVEKNSPELLIVENRDIYANPPPPISLAYPVHGNLVGLIFDMDGTLTEPGAINFGAMYSRIGFNKRKGVDILTQIFQDLPLHEHEAAHAVIIDEELKGCDAMKLQPDLSELLEYLNEHSIRAAISTRNCAEAFDRFRNMAKLSDKSFSPILSRESLNGINKPDPQVALHILEAWDAVDRPHEVWFIGDSIDDMKCGKGAGCRTCFVTTPSMAHDPSHAAFIDISVTSLREFIEHIRYHDVVIR